MVGIVSFLFAGIAFNMTQVFDLSLFFCYFSCINLSSWMTLTVFLIVFIFLRDLGLRVTYINKREIMDRLNLVSILRLLIDYILVFFG